MLTPFTVAAAQTTPAPGDVDANVEQHLRLMRAAETEGVGLLAFPELSLTGYELDRAERLAFSEQDGRLTPLVDAAWAASMTVVVGAPVRLGDHRHIGAFIIRPSGAPVLYTKHTLGGAFPSEVSPDGVVPPAESSVFAPGTSNPPLTVAGRSVAIGLCAETLTDPHPAAAAARGAQVYLACHFGIYQDVAYRGAILRKHATRHGMMVVFANYGGRTGGLEAGGKSAVWSGTGECVVELSDAGTGLAIASDDAGTVRGRVVELESLV